MEAKIYNAETHELVARSTAVNGNTAVFNDSYDPLTGSEGGWVKFKMATTDATPIEQPAVLKVRTEASPPDPIHYLIVVHNINSEDYHLIGTSTGDGYSSENQCQYISDVSPLTLVNCASNESVNVRLEFTPIVLGWPLETSYASRSVNQAFGVNWSTGQTCNDGVHGDLVEKHNGIDYYSVSGNKIYAAEAGTVKHMELHSPWAQHIVIEHTAPGGWKYTTVYWHVDSEVAVNDSVTKGEEIATVANLGGDTHFHFGVRVGEYNSVHSGTGALPQTECVINSATYQPFPFGFINPNDTDYVQYQ